MRLTDEFAFVYLAPVSKILTLRNFLTAIPAAVAVIVNREVLVAWLRSISGPIVYSVALILIVVGAVTASLFLAAAVWYVGALLRALVVQLARRFYEKHFGWISAALKEHEARIKSLERWQKRSSVYEDDGMLYLPDFLPLERIGIAVKAYSRQHGLGDHLSETITRDLLMGGRPEGHSYRVFSYKDGASPSVAWMSTRERAESYMTRDPHPRRSVLVHVTPEVFETRIMHQGARSR